MSIRSADPIPLPSARGEAPLTSPSSARQVYAVPGAFDRSSAHMKRAHDLIPGGAHTYAKGDDQFPEHMTPVIVRGQGCHVFDLDGNRYIELGSGLRSVTLGHAHPRICEAAARAMHQGTNFVRPAALELQAAEAMLANVPGADMIKFAKNGSDATTAAVKLARAYTGRDLIALCHDQPFFSTDDWFICTTPMDAGITEATRRETLTFRFNNLQSLQDLFDQFPNRIAAVLMEAERDEVPAPGYLQAVKELAHRNGALLIFDEVIAGMRLGSGGGQVLHNITPDLSTFGKAIANGFALAALAGKREFMELGGLRQAERDRVFLLSTTNGAESHALAASIETIAIYRERDVISNLRRIGETLRDGFNAISREHGIADYLQTAGHPSNLVFVTKDPDHHKSQPYRTLFMQELIRRGVLAPSLVVSDAITERDLDHLFWAIDGAAGVYARALSDGIEPFLEGRPVKPVFRKRI